MLESCIWGKLNVFERNLHTFVSVVLSNNVRYLIRCREVEIQTKRV